MSKKLSKRLIDYYSSIFLDVLEIDQSLAQGIEPEKNCPQALDDIKENIKTADLESKKDGYNNDDVHLAQFALCAWIDEMFAKNNQWSKGFTPLQVTFFSTRNAGNEFYEKMDSLREEQEQVREVFYMALCLGFLGENYQETGPAGKIQQIIDQNSMVLPITPEKIAEMENKKITPQPYEQNDPKPRRFGRFWLKVILGLLLLASILGAIYYYFFYLPDKDYILREARKILNPVECSKLVPSVDDEFTLYVKGYLGQEGELVRINKKLAAIHGVRKVDNQSTIYPWPLCEMIGILEDETDLSNGSPKYPRVRPIQKGLFFREGDKLTLTANGPDTESYVYIDYIQKDGYVVHLMPIQRLPNNKARPGQELLLGSGTSPNQPIFVIKPPFGKDMVIIYSSPKPLFNFIRPDVETAEVYMKSLREAIQKLKEQNPSIDIRSDYYIISTTQ